MLRIRRPLLAALALAAGVSGVGAVGTPTPALAQGGLPGTGSSCPTEPHLVECLRVNANATSAVFSKELNPGVYRVVSSGAWKNVDQGVNVLVDAECSDPGTGAAAVARGEVEGSPDRLDLQIEGAAQTWVPATPTIAGCSPSDKKFETYVQVDVKDTLSFKIDDDDPLNNLGGLDVKIYDAAAELGVPLKTAGIVKIYANNRNPVFVKAAKWSKAVVMVRGRYQWSANVEHVADAECAKVTTEWSPTAIQDDTTGVYQPYQGQDYLDVHVDGRDQHLVPVLPQVGETGPGVHCETIGHGYIHPGKTMLVESDRVRFEVFDWAYGDNSGVLFGIVLGTVSPHLSAPTPAPLLYGEAMTLSVPPVRQGDVVVSNSGAVARSGQLAPGVYELKATGSWWNGGLLIDAECTTEYYTTAWTRERADSQGNPAPGNGDLRVNGAATEWTPATPDGTGCAATPNEANRTLERVYHAYVTVPPGGGMVELQIDNPIDNPPTAAGSISVAFRQVTHALTGPDVYRSVQASAATTAVFGMSTTPQAVPLAGAGDQFLLAEGTFRYRHYNEADAECSYGMPRKWVAEQGADNPDVVIDGAERTWGPTTPSGGVANLEHVECPTGRHERWLTLPAGLGSSVTAVVQDTYHGDNGGALVLTAFQLV